MRARADREGVREGAEATATWDKSHHTRGGAAVPSLRRRQMLKILSATPATPSPSERARSRTPSGLSAGSRDLDVDRGADAPWPPSTGMKGRGPSPRRARVMVLTCAGIKYDPPPSPPPSTNGLPTRRSSPRCGARWRLTLGDCGRMALYRSTTRSRRPVLWRFEIGRSRKRRSSRSRKALSPCLLTSGKIPTRE